MTSGDLRCYTSETDATASTLTVAAGDQLSFHVNDALTIYHQGVVNVYMAQVPSGSDAASFAGDGDIWFKVFEMPPVVQNGQLTFPSESMSCLSGSSSGSSHDIVDLQSFTFPIPKSLPSGQYLIRVEHVRDSLA